MITNYNLFINELYDTNYQKFYYLVLNGKENAIEGLKNREFKGLIGISDSEKIIEAYFDIRDILLVMPKVECDKLNNLLKIDYLDIDLLCNDNFKVYKRIYQVDDSYNIESLIYQAVQRKDRISFKIGKKLSVTSQIVNMYKHIYNYRFDKKNSYYDLLYLVNRYCHKIIPEQAENFKDLCEKVYNNLQDETIINSLGTYHDYDPKKIDFSIFNKKVIEYILKFILLNFVDGFKSEGEVLVTSDTFKIPDNSFLIVKKMDERFNDYNWETEIKNMKDEYPTYWINKGSKSHINAYHIIRNYERVFK